MPSVLYSSYVNTYWMLNIKYWMQRGNNFFIYSFPCLNQVGCLLIEAISRWKHAHIASEAVRPPRSEAAMPCWAAEYIGFVRQTSLWGWEQGRRNRGCREGQRNAYHKTSTNFLFLWKNFNYLPEYVFLVLRIIVLDNLTITRDFVLIASYNSNQWKDVNTFIFLILFTVRVPSYAALDLKPLSFISRGF